MNGRTANIERLGEPSFQACAPRAQRAALEQPTIRGRQWGDNQGGKRWFMRGLTPRSASLAERVSC
jgi:hypothetical protein